MTLLISISLIVSKLYNPFPSKSSYNLFENSGSLVWVLEQDARFDSKGLVFNKVIYNLHDVAGKLEIYNTLRKKINILYSWKALRYNKLHGIIIIYYLQPTV